ACRFSNLPHDWQCRPWRIARTSQRAQPHAAWRRVALGAPRSGRCRFENVGLLTSAGETETSIVSEPGVTSSSVPCETIDPALAAARRHPEIKVPTISV